MQDAVRILPTQMADTGFEGFRPAARLVVRIRSEREEVG
jgi:hypothetical protein